jgi:nicotinamidase/pyrazinamidase
MAEQHNVAVIYANDAHAQDDPEFKAWPRHAVKGKIGARVIYELAPSNGALVIEKQDLSMFTNPEADKILREKGINELYVMGVATEYCVRGAVLDAAKLNYKVNVVMDAIAGVDVQKGDQYRALLEMGNAGARPVYAKQALEEIVK